MSLLHAGGFCTSLSSQGFETCFPLGLQKGEIRCHQTNKRWLKCSPSMGLQGKSKSTFMIIEGVKEIATEGLTEVTQGQHCFSEAVSTYIFSDNERRVSEPSYSTGMDTWTGTKSTAQDRTAGGGVPSSRAAAVSSPLAFGGPACVCFLIKHLLCA